MRKIGEGRGIVAVMLGAGAMALAGCGPQSPEEARADTIAQCEMQFGRIAPDAAQGTQLCTCLADKLAAEGLAITDMLGGDRSKIEGMARSCASEAGVSLPTG